MRASLCTGKATAARGRLTKSEFVSIGSPEETVLETYFVILSKMNFEKAREQCVGTFFVS